MVPSTAGSHPVVSALSRLQTKGTDETELDNDVSVLALSSERFYTDFSTDTAEVTEKRGADNDIELTPYVTEVLTLAVQIAEEEIDVTNLCEFIQTQAID